MKEGGRDGKLVRWNRGRGHVHHIKTKGILEGTES